MFYWKKIQKMKIFISFCVLSLVKDKCKYFANQFIWFCINFKSSGQQMLCSKSLFVLLNNQFHSLLIAIIFLSVWGFLFSYNKSFKRFIYIYRTSTLSVLILQPYTLDRFKCLVKTSPFTRATKSALHSAWHFFLQWSTTPFIIQNSINNKLH